MTEKSQNLIVSYMGADMLLVHQISTGGGLNLTFQEAREVIKLLTERLPIRWTEEENEQHS